MSKAGDDGRTTRRRPALPARRDVWRRIRADGAPAVALAVLVFAAALAGRAPIWLALPVGLAALVVGLTLLSAGTRPAEAADTPPPVPAHVRAAALAAHVLLIVLVVAVVINAAQGWITSFPWFQLLLTGLCAYLAGLLWYRRRPR